jgi:copper chaperone CopZ
MTTRRGESEATRHVALPIRDGSTRTASSIEDALRRVPGVTHVHVNLRTEMVYVEHEALRCDERTLRETLDRAGCGEGPKLPRTSEKAGREPWRSLARIMMGAGRVVRRVRDSMLSNTADPRRPR